MGGGAQEHYGLLIPTKHPLCILPRPLVIPIPPCPSTQEVSKQWTLILCVLAKMCQTEVCPGNCAITKPALHPAVTPGDSLEILRVLGDGHVDDIQGVLVMLLGREEQY